MLNHVTRQLKLRDILKTVAGGALITPAVREIELLYKPNEDDNG